MRVNVVSDVHGADRALARAADDADALICLGDLVLFLDYDDLAQGIFGEIFGVEDAREFVRLRTARRYAEASAFGRSRWEGAEARLGLTRAELLERHVRAQYEALFAVMPEPAYLTYGNVDVPAYWQDYLRPGHHVLDGEATDLDGVRLGFVGGGLVSPMRTPFERDEASFASRLGSLGPVDVLCAHIPPAVPELTYDVVARRFEVGSRAILEYVRDVQPRLVLFGHVHQPLRPRTRIGRTECVNVGHFRGTGSGLALRW